MDQEVSTKHPRLGPRPSNLEADIEDPRHRLNVLLGMGAKQKFLIDTILCPQTRVPDPHKNPWAQVRVIFLDQSPLLAPGASFCMQGQRDLLERSTAKPEFPHESCGRNLSYANCLLVGFLQLLAAAEALVVLRGPPAPSAQCFPPQPQKEEATNSRTPPGCRMPDCSSRLSLHAALLACARMMGQP